MGKVSKAVKSRPSSSTADDVTTMPQVTTPSQGLSPPQFTALVSLAVSMSTFLTLRRAVVFDGIGSALCDAIYASPSDSSSSSINDVAAEDEDKDGGGGFGCVESQLFFLALRHHRSVLFLALRVVMLLFCWTEAPLLQRFNHCLCVSPISTTLASVVAHASRLDAKHVATTAFVNLGMLVLTNMSHRSGMAPCRVGWVRDMVGTPHGLSLLATLVLSVGFGAWMSLVGPEGASDFFDGEGGDGDNVALDSSRAEAMFVGVESLNWAVVVAFALIFLDDVRKRVVMITIGFSNLYQIFRQLPVEKEHLVHVGKLNEVLFGTAVSLLFFSLLPSSLTPSALSSSPSSSSSSSSSLTTTTSRRARTKTTAAAAAAAAAITAKNKKSA